MSFDQTLFRAINTHPVSDSLFWWFLSEGNKVLVGQVFIVFVFIALLRKSETRAIGVLALLSIGLANEITDIAKSMYPVARPCVAELDAIVRVKMLTSAGTLSAHSANGAAFASVLFWHRNRWRWVGLIYALLVGFSRMAVGVHYPSQVLGGWLAGAVVATVVCATWNAWLVIRKKRAPAAAEAPESED